MASNWKSWCRLCARSDGLENELDSQYFDAIIKYFSVDLHLDDWPKSICTRCQQFVTTLINFLHRTSKVQAMFAELLNNLEQLDTDQIKAKYEIEELGDVEMDLELLSSSSPKHDTATDVASKQAVDVKDDEQIDKDILSEPLIKIEQIDDFEINSVEQEWSDEQQPEQDKEEDCSAPEETEDDESYEEKPKVKKKGKTMMETFSCSVCQKEISQYKKYAHHMEKEHGVTVDRQPYACSKCNKRYSSKKSYINHESSHQQPHACSICNKSYSSKRACSNHEITHQQPSTPSETKPLIQCPYCDNEYTESYLRLHIKFVHIGAKSFICEICGKGFKTHNTLKDHKLSHSDDRPFQCPSCEKSFKNKYLLKRHEDTHNDTNYICNTCGLKLNTRRTLQMHMLVHSDQKRHKCNFCGKEYKRAKSLKLHLIMHIGLQPFSCNFCDKTFTNNQNCRSHKKKVHPIEMAELGEQGAKTISSKVPKLEQLRALCLDKTKSVSAEPMPKED